MPALFVGHGSPMNAIEENEFVAKWRSLGDEIPQPKAILSISAHWETRGTKVTAMPTPKTIHDFGGFPRELYQIQYPAPGNPELAHELIHQLHSVEADSEWGLDHGTWSILRQMYPDANVPVLQLSLDVNKSPLDHLEFARSLRKLRNEGVLILGSGNVVHNLRRVAWDKMNEDGYLFDWAQEANQKIKDLIIKNDLNTLADYSKLGVEVQMAVPTPEHFLPLIYILALQDENDQATFFNDKGVMGSLTMTSVKIQ